jgi:hypothetical protein
MQPNLISFVLLHSRTVLNLTCIPAQTQKCVMTVGVVHIFWFYKAEEEDFEFYACTKMSSSVTGNNN